MMMRRNGSKQRSRVFSSLRSYGFPAPEPSDHSPMLFVDLLTRPGHQGKASREPRLRHRLRISIILLLRQHVFHSCCSMQYLRWVGGGIHTIKIRPIYQLDPTEGPGSYRDLLYGVLLPAAPAQAFEDAWPPDESGPHPKGIERCAVLDSSLQGHRRTLCHAKPRHHRCKTHSVMRWPDLERGPLPDAAGTDAQNRPDQRLKQTTV